MVVRAIFLILLLCCEVLAQPGTWYCPNDPDCQPLRCPDDTVGGGLAMLAELDVAALNNGGVITPSDLPPGRFQEIFGNTIGDVAWPLNPINLGQIGDPNSPYGRLISDNPTGTPRYSFVPPILRGTDPLICAQGIDLLCGCPGAGLGATMNQPTGVPPMFQQGVICAPATPAPTVTPVPSVPTATPTVLGGGGGGETPTPTPTPTPTGTLEPTGTPTNTPLPTVTPPPSPTPVPTFRVGPPDPSQTPIAIDPNPWCNNIPGVAAFRDTTNTGQIYCWPWPPIFPLPPGGCPWPGVMVELGALGGSFCVYPENPVCPPQPPTSRADKPYGSYCACVVADGLGNMILSEKYYDPADRNCKCPQGQSQNPNFPESCSCDLGVDRGAGLGCDCDEPFQNLQDKQDSPGVCECKTTKPPVNQGPLNFVVGGFAPDPDSGTCQCPNDAEAVEDPDFPGNFSCQCKPGHIPNPAPFGRAGCAKCPAGSNPLLVQGQPTCRCNIDNGKIEDVNPGGSCTCQLGKILEVVNGVPTCSDCPPGEIPNAAGNACEACLPWQINNLVACFDCPAGQIPNPTRDACMNCPLIGQVPDVSGVSCVCQGGRVEDIATGSCVCPPGLPNEVNGICSLCPAGQVFDELRPGGPGCVPITPDPDPSPTIDDPVSTPVSTAAPGPGGGNCPIGNPSADTSNWSCTGPPGNEQCCRIDSGTGLVTAVCCLYAF